MFENSLIDLEEKQRPRRRWAPLPVAVGLHVAVLASVALAEVWNVNAVGDPDLVTAYHVVSLPPPPPPLSGGSPAPRAAVTPPVPAAPQTPVQPDTEEVPDLEPAAPAPAAPGAADLPFVEGGSPFGSRDGVQGGVQDGEIGGDVNSQGGIGWNGPAAPTPRDEILRFDGTMTRPKQLSGQPPRYTEVARRAGIQGAVILEAVIDERGRVRDVRILKGLPMGLDQEAVSAVRDWVFEPARLGERPVKVYYTLTVHFEIQR